MNTSELREKLDEEFRVFGGALASDGGEWIIKGFIDVYKNIYTISVDTKVVSKLIELMLFPALSGFASRNNLKLVLSEHQNHYPDVTLVDEEGKKFALDLKSTYRTSPAKVNGFTLGAFTGYFRQRDSLKNVRFPYGDYAAHLVLGVIYTRSEIEVDEKKRFSIGELQDIPSVVKDFDFLVQEKWRLASDKPGSGNTKNIGSSNDMVTLKNGSGCFSSLGESGFDDYWMNYLTKDMARSIDSSVPYKSLAEYLAWRSR